MNLFGLTISRGHPKPERQLHGGVTIRRDYDAALSDRLFSDWKLAVGYSPTVLATQYPVMVARSREQAKNNPYVRAILRLYRQNVIGHIGMLFRPLPMDPGGKIDTGAAAILWEAFDQWGTHPEWVDAGGRFNFRCLCEAIAIGLVRDGNAFIRLLPGFGYPANPFGFSVQMLPATSLDTALNIDDGNRRIYNGVEVDAWRRPIRYWFRKPSASDRLNPLPTQFIAGEHEVFPADEILHVYDRAEEPEACIGVPWLYSVLTRLKMLGEYEFAELVASREDACSTGQYETAPGTDFSAEDAFKTFETGASQLKEMSPGEREVIPPGMKFVKNAPTRPNAGVNDFRKGMLQGIASGAGPAYNGLANDLEGVNFSSIRTGKMDERDLYMGVQQLVIEQAASPIFAHLDRGGTPAGWLGSFLLSGRSGLPMSKFAKFAAHQFRGRRWPWVDPMSDAKYNELCRQYGWKTDDTIAGEIGEDWESNAIATKALATTAKGTYLEPNYAKETPKPGAGQPGNGKPPAT